MELANILGFKGGTALMFFYDLLDVEKQDGVYRNIRQILLKYGKILDEAKKFYGPLIVPDVKA